MTGVDDMVQWLRTQIDEEAEEASQGDDLSWHDEGCAWVTVTWHGTNEPKRGWPCDCGVPARRLAEIEAKRRLLDLADRLAADAAEAAGGPHPEEAITLAATARSIRATVALPYAGRSGYRDEWRHEPEPNGR